MFKRYGLSLFVCVTIFSCNDDESPGPEFSSVSPLSGAKGTTLTISGANFGTKVEDIEITVNGKIAPVISVISSKIEATVPEKAGTGKVVIKVRGVTMQDQPEFTYLLSVSTLSGNGEEGYTDGSRTVARFSGPSGLSVLSNGDIMVTDYLNYAIRKITPDGTVSTIAGGSPGYVEGVGTAAKLYFPDGIEQDATGNYYIADEGNHVIRKLDLNGAVTTFAGSGDGGFLDATGTAAYFAVPSGIAIDGQGNLYVADQFNHRIRKITPQGVVTTLAGKGTAGFADGLGNTAQFNRPAGVAVDATGNVFVGDLFNNRIRKITPSGEVTTLAGVELAGFADGSKLVAKFNKPSGLAFGPDGILYVCDGENRAIRMIDVNGNVSTLTGRSEGYVDGLLSEALFRLPRDIDFAADGTIYIADYSSNCIRKID